MSDSFFTPHHMCSFDLETTGPNPRTARIVTSSCLDIDLPESSSTGVEPHLVTHNWLADPGCDIPAEATAVHGISTEQARREGSPHAKVVKETVAHLYAAWEEGRTLIVYNASFDLTILQHWEPTFEVRGLVLDPYVVDRALDKYRKGKRTLGIVCEHYQVSLDNAHNSDADAWSAAQLATRLADVYPQLLTTPADDLMALQTEWHRERQQSLREYLERVGRDSHSVETEWPLLGPLVQH